MTIVIQIIGIMWVISGTIGLVTFEMDTIGHLEGVVKSMLGFIIIVLGYIYELQSQKNLS